MLQRKLFRVSKFSGFILKVGRHINLPLDSTVISFRHKFNRAIPITSRNRKVRKSSISEYHFIC